jgi:phosphoglycerate dehydrogenase-like enzyme
MEPVTFWVVAPSDDTGLSSLARPPAGVRFVIGSRAEDFANAPPADVLLACAAGRRVFEPVFAMAPNVRWVHSRSAGLDGLLFPALVEGPVVLTNARGVYSESLAEFVIAGALFFAKDFARMRRNQAAGRWEQFDVEEIAGRTLLVVGYGDIGRAAGRKARGLGMKVIGLRRTAERPLGDDAADEIGALADRLAFLPRADYVAVAAPLVPESRKLVGEAEIAAMKPGAVVINVGRGPVIDEQALVRALEQGRIRGAALDVFEEEPLAAGHPFYRLENVLLSPHCADHTATWLEDSMQLFLANLDRFRKGEPLRNPVDKARGY